jgi:hypothetical protein
VIQDKGFRVTPAEWRLKFRHGANVFSTLPKSTPRPSRTSRWCIQTQTQNRHGALICALQVGRGVDDHNVLVVARPRIASSIIPRAPSKSTGDHSKPVLVRPGAASITARGAKDLASRGCGLHLSQRIENEDCIPPPPPVLEISRILKTCRPCLHPNNMLKFVGAAVYPPTDGGLLHTDKHKKLGGSTEFSH